MKLNWYQSESTQIPKDIEVYSDVVLLHKDVEEIDRLEEDQIQTTIYSYKEAKLTPSQYAQYLAERNAANIDYLSMELEVEL